MAHAGFYCCPTKESKDLVKCFMCSKELDGWKASDNPMSEITLGIYFPPFFSS
jgi:baculoviral IAP repeat-containing protein 5